MYMQKKNNNTNKAVVNIFSLFCYSSGLLDDSVPGSL